MEIEKLARKYAVKNAYEYGKANVGSVLSKVISKAPEAKADMRALSALIGKVVDEVNSLDRSSLEEEYNGYADEFGAEESAKRAASKPKFELPGAVMGKVVTRFSPEPSGFMHIGHTKAALIAETFARQYNGMFCLHFDDTNPENERQEFVDQFHKDLEWLGMGFDKEYYSSDHIEHIYSLAKRLIDKGSAYVCTCDRETIKKNRFDGRECEHRARQPAESLEMFEGMLNGDYEEEQAIVRFKYDMSHQNTTLRDPTMLRIKRATHYRQGDKYIVWPSYYFNTPIIDSVMGITDAMRSKEYEQSEALYREILSALGLRVPNIYAFSRLNIKGNITSKRKLRALIKAGDISGYDDPRLMTIAALRRRGVQPKAIRELMLNIGFSKAESVIDQAALFAENRKIIDPIAKHLFFVSNPIKVVVEGTTQKDVRLKLHPHGRANEFREYRTNNTFYISGSDAETINPGESVRLKDLFDVQIETSTANHIRARAASDEVNASIIHWVADPYFVECSVSLPGDLLTDEEEYNPDSMKVEKGFVESYARNLKKGDIVQFERFGYAVLDDKERMDFIFISK
ncbi:MAG: glutamate--tRNA ligase [Candidatus Micrarchaeota archaeon]|nr:glutamate--tRNA ligase [Candidatus Micrarchaeota archaeon]